jgi:hypothetical protein
MALGVARKLARIITENVDKKHIKEVLKPEFLDTAPGRNLVRKFITHFLKLREYDALFPSQHHPIRIETSGWQFLRYYLTRKEQNEGNQEPITTLPMKTTHPKIIQLAEVYVQGRDPKKIKNLLDRMAQKKVGIRWLEDVFCRLAEQHLDWNFGTWDEFVCDEDGNIVVHELFFQLRLYMSNLYREAISKNQGEAA